MKGSMTSRFKTKCPCCKATVLVDPDRRRILSLGDGADAGDLLENADALLEEEEKQRGASFERAFEEETTKKTPRLEDLL